MVVVLLGKIGRWTIGWVGEWALGDSCEFEMLLRGHLAEWACDGREYAETAKTLPFPKLQVMLLDCSRL